MPELFTASHSSSKVSNSSSYQGQSKVYMIALFSFKYSSNIHNMQTTCKHYHIFVCTISYKTLHQPYMSEPPATPGRHLPSGTWACLSTNYITSIQQIYLICKLSAYILVALITTNTLQYVCILYIYVVYLYKLKFKQSTK